MGIDFKAISESLDIKTVARDLGLNVNRAGFISCPLHYERTASCKLYEHSFYCYGCNSWGDSIDLVAAVRGISKADAARELNGYYNVGVDLGGRQVKRIRRNQNSPLEKPAQVKRMVDLFADTAREARRAGIADSLLVWFDETHQAMLEDDSLRLSAPEIFIEKWKGAFDRYEHITSKYNRIVQALHDARVAAGEYRYPEERILDIMGRTREVSD